jgi:hypothetical protein
VNRADWVVLAAVLLLALSMVAEPADGFGIDGRLVLAAALIAVLARPATHSKEAL